MMRPGACAVILLASGYSRRFGPEDKLLAAYDGRPVLSHIAGLWASASERFAVVPEAAPDRTVLLRTAGWRIISNDAPDKGQGYSLARGIAAVAQTDAEAVLILLGDMPLISEAHLARLSDMFTPGTEAVMSARGDVLMPPAIFSRSCFPALARLDGDRGARAIFDGLRTTRICQVPDGEAQDIDTIDDLKRLTGDIAHG